MSVLITSSNRLSFQTDTKNEKQLPIVSRAVILFCIIKKLTIFHFLHSTVHKLEHGKVGFALSPLSRSKIKNEALIVRNDIPQRSSSPVVKYFLFGMLYF